MSNDEDLIAASRRDPAAFEPLVERHGAAVHAYLARRTSVADADDLLADVWLAAFASRTSFDPGLGPFRGWLFGVARHVLLAHVRRVRRNGRATDLGPAVGDETWEATDARLDAAATAPALRAALAALPTVERDLLLLVAWEQLTPAEAARALDIPAGTARSRLHRARRGMSEHLAAHGQVPDDGSAGPRGAER